MLRTIIVEDEQPILEWMKLIAEESGFFEIVGTFTSPKEALERYASLAPDAAFLDIEMPKMSGLELAEHIASRDERVQIVFTTAYKQYALDAFRVQAVDYLLKPVTPEAVQKVAHRLMKTHDLLKRRPPSAVPSTRIRCMGTFDVKGADGETVSWPTRKTEELFAYFLVYPNQWISKWVLADLLWPDMEESRALHNVHNTMYRLKKVLKESGFELELKTTNEGYSLQMPHGAACDVGQFRQFMRGVSAADSANAEQCETLLHDYESPLFGGKDYLWSLGAAEELGGLFAALTRMLVVHYRGSGDKTGVERCIRKYLSIEPLDEEMNAALLQLYVEAGDAGAFRKQYGLYKQRLLDEIGVEPPKLARELADKVGVE
ncbi:response regulator [Paenibacillus mesophilus]|uniref:response regulator n=1 Tax=Paenibacillus mesophilus TaxID=2582849 RepID=UPI00110F1465|nr:response regulator [Paenibacillus mesophilus]TMV48423.1 response regulator [Paenibacillus mesophilus]